MIYAVYRCLYGEDFIQESINSITEFVDRIFIFWDDTPWGNITECIYKGEKISFPKKFDNILDKIRALNNQKIELIYDHQYNNVNQFTHFVNDIILRDYERPDTIMFIEVDHVFTSEQLQSCLVRSDYMSNYCCTSGQVELWKTPYYRVPKRRRMATIFWNMRNINGNIPDTGRHANLKGIPYIEGYVHNFGYCVSKEVMYWKHLTALGFSQKIGDSLPNEGWYDKWLNWDFETNNKDLEPAAGYEHKIPYAAEHDVSDLPQSIKDMYEIT